MRTFFLAIVLHNSPTVHATVKNKCDCADIAWEAFIFANGGCDNFSTFVTIRFAMSEMKVGHLAKMV